MFIWYIAVLQCTAIRRLIFHRPAVWHPFPRGHNPSHLHVYETSAIIEKLKTHGRWRFKGLPAGQGHLTELCGPLLDANGVTTFMGLRAHGDSIPA